MTQQAPAAPPPNTDAAPPVVSPAAAMVRPPQQGGGAPVPYEGDALNPFASAGNFGVALRVAEKLSYSTMVPKAYQGEQGIQNIVIAMEMASRHRSSLFAVMQSLNIIHGKPSWSSTYLIATVNSCGRFTPLRWREVGTKYTDSWGMIAFAKDKESGEVLEGPEVTIAMAKAEEWATKNGSKWKTLPELMLRYRSAAFWTRLYAPELSLGMQTADEMSDLGDVGEHRANGGNSTDAIRALEAQLRATAAQPPRQVQVVDAETEPVETQTKPPAPTAAAAQPALVSDKPLVDKPPQAVAADAHAPTEPAPAAARPTAQASPPPPPQAVPVPASDVPKPAKAAKKGLARDGSDGSVPADQEPPEGGGAWDPPEK